MVHVGAMRMTTDLERIGDYAKNTAKRVAAPQVWEISEPTGAVTELDVLDSCA